MVEKTTLVELSKKNYRYFDAFIKIMLGDFPRRNIPQLMMNENDEGCYSNDTIIQIGLLCVLFSLCENDEEALSAIEYLLSHEGQHCRSTPTKYWKWGIEQGVKALCQEISSKVEGPGKRRFRKEGDVENFCYDMAKKKNLYISVNLMERMCHSIQNAIEDGRIERIRAEKSPGFKAGMLFHRSRLWSWLTTEKTFGENLPDVDDMPDFLKLSLILQQIISLCTMGLYQKGFLDMYGDSELVDTIDSLADSLRKGVLSPNCKGAMMAAVEVEKALADLIIETCTADRDALEQALKSLVQMMSENFSPSLTTDKEEEGSDGNSASGNSESDNSGEEKDSGNSESDDSDAENDSNSASGNSESDNSGEEKDSDENFSDGEIDEMAAASKHSFMPNGLNSMSKGHRNVGDSAEEISAEELEEAKQQIRKAMEAAAAETLSNAASILSSAPAKPSWEEQSDMAPSVTAASLGMPEKCSDVDFEELKRAYKVDYDMPVDLEGRALNFKNKIERLFRNQVKPVVKGHQSGKIDASGIYKLLMKQTDFYERRGQAPEFNGVGYILQDNSGSMGCGRGSGREYACEGMAIIEEALKNIMPLKITAFDSAGSNQVTHEVVNNFDEKLHKNCSYNFLLGGRSGYGNKDGYSIRVATRELLARPEKEKILVIASDGCPSCYSDYAGGLADVNQAVKEARASGIKVVGIYFSAGAPDPDFARMYETDYVCTTPDRMEEELQKVLQNFVFH